MCCRHWLETEAKKFLNLPDVERIRRIGRHTDEKLDAILIMLGINDSIHDAKEGVTKQERPYELEEPNINYFLNPVEAKNEYVTVMVEPDRVTLLSAERKGIRAWDKITTCFSGGTVFPALWSHNVVVLDLSCGFVHIDTLLELYGSSTSKPVDVGITVGKNFVPSFMNNLEATDNLSTLPGIGVCGEAEIEKNTILEGDILPLEMNDSVKGATVFRGGTMLSRMMVWIQLATCFRGGTTCFEGYRGHPMFLDEVTFIWMITWHTLVVSVVRMDMVMFLMIGAVIIKGFNSELIVVLTIWMRL
ncbi:OLC1v1000376C1 [Oldenlandia corymbosa var. corymbosa]|uniref:OLC1v1000376C1 n=1 Tax=Oldenlandia corymbosa var. corymbosa TaxID=529605 RepID=A0AAV1D2T5_OLDCO|nr:OLC1v1000376C1 [Oldenlandia corymbosa var. corymbosa]